MNINLSDTLALLQHIRSNDLRNQSVEYCRLILGNRGSGKSVGLIRDELRLGIARDYALLAIDAPEELLVSSVGHLDANGIRSRTYVDFARKTDRVLNWRFARRSTAQDPFQRQIEDNFSIMELCHGLYARRDAKGGEKSPLIDRYLKAAVAIWLSQKDPKPLNWIIKIFDPGSPEHTLLMDGAEDRAAVHIFKKIERIRYRSPSQYANETGPAERMLQPLASPVIYLRHGDSVDWTDLLVRKAQVFFGLAGVSPDEGRTLAIFAYTAVINACRRYYAQHRKPLKVVILLEEAGALDLVTPFLITAMQELRKAGVVVWLVSQTSDDFRDTQIFEQLMGLVEERIYYRLSSGLDRVAQDITAPIFDPLEVHYERDQQFRIGEREVPTKSKGTSKGPDGKERSDEREGITFLPEYETRRIQYYKPYQLKESEIRQQLTTLKTFERFVVSPAGVGRESVPPLPEPWPFGLTEIRTKQAIEDMRRRPCYVTPKIFSPPPAPKKKGKGGVQ